MRAIVYVRVSRVRGRTGDAFLSPTQQAEACEAYVSMKRGSIVARIEDLDVSGGTIERPGFQRALGMIEAGDADTLVVAKLDRFGRTIPGIYEAVRRIEDGGGHFVSVSDGFDLTQPTGHLLLGVLAAFAEYELRRLKAGWDDVHIRNVEAGIPTRFPWGYERGVDLKRRPDDREGRGLVATAEGRQYVPELFRRAAEGTRPQDLALWLSSEGLRTHTGVPWTRTTVARLLSRRVYLGEVWFGDLVNPEAHEPLTDPATFQAAQQPARAAIPSRGSGLLTGIARCAGCRFTLKHLHASPSRPYPVYRCERKSVYGCPAPVQANAAELERIVEERVFEMVEAEVAGIAQAGGVPAEHADALAELERVQAAREAVAAVRDVLPDAEGQLATLDSRIAALEGQLDEVPEAEPVTPEDYYALPLEERRELLAATLDVVFVRNTGRRGLRTPLAPRVLVLSRGDGPPPEELPRRGYSRVLAPVAFEDYLPAGAGVTS